MRILIVSDSYKGSCTSMEAAEAIEKGINRVDKSIYVEKLSVADGGEGTLDTIISKSAGQIREVEVLDPLGRPIISKYGVLPNNVAIIEMATASGIELLEFEEYNPLKTSTYGTGQLIKDAINSGVKKIYIGIGGSATNDGGVGMAQALGGRFLDEHGIEIGFGGEELLRIKKIDISSLEVYLKDVEIVIMSDVENVLCGPNGASFIYGPQKGASLKDIKILDKALNHLAQIIEIQLKKDIKNIKGSGAAGGLGGGLVAFCRGTIRSGINEILELIGIDEYLKKADLIITGEGRIDSQSIYGKVPIGVAVRAKSHNIPVIAIVGSIGEGYEKAYEYGIDLIMGIIDQPMSLENAIENTKELIERTSERAIRGYLNLIKY